MATTAVSMSTSDPFRHSLRTALRYVAAVVSVSAALIGTLGLGPVMRTTPTILFFCAVMVSSWFGGLWPGILASLLSMFALDYYFIAPIYTFVIESIVSRSATCAKMAG